MEMDETIRTRLTELLVKLESHAIQVTAALSQNQGLHSLLLLHRDTAKKEIRDHCQQVRLIFSLGRKVPCLSYDNGKPVNAYLLKTTKQLN